MAQLNLNQQARLTRRVVLLLGALLFFIFLANCSGFWCEPYEVPVPQKEPHRRPGDFPEPPQKTKVRITVRDPQDAAYDVPRDVIRDNINCQFWDPDALTHEDDEDLPDIEITDEDQEDLCE